MKKYFILLITMLLFPTIAFAEVVSIKDSDFIGADNTLKGITYDSTKYCYQLASNEYKLTGDIYKNLCLNGVSVTLDLDGHTIHTNNLFGPVQGTDVNLTITGNGVIYGDENYEDYGVTVKGNSNLIIESGTIAGIHTENDNNGVYGTAHIKGGTITEPSDLSIFDEVIIDDLTVEVNSGGLGIHKANNVTINDITCNNGTGIVGFSNVDSLIINDGDLYGPGGLYMEGPVNNIEINGGNFRGKMYSAMFQITDISNPNVKLKGGTFSVDDPNTAMGNILVVVNGEADEDILKTILYPGFEFSDEIVVETMHESGMTAFIIKNAVSVVHSDYEVLDGDGQTINLDEDFTLKFEFSTILNEFLESGEIYIDGELVDQDNYVATEGSTIITFISDFIKTIGIGEHEVTLMTDYGDITATYTAIKSGEEETDPKDEEEKEIPDEKEEETTPTDGKSSEDELNPKTGDNIMTYALLTIISGVGLISIRKCKRN